MKTRILGIILLVMAQTAIAQNISNFYTQAYGDAKNPAIIFLHGGPGYNAVSFEVSTAQTLAAQGFYVVVYDQRGSGRTKKDSTSKFTFSEAFDDLNAIYAKYKLTTATLIGHSYGGTLGMLFANAYPEKVSSLIMVSAPLSFQQTFRNIIARCRKIYTETSSVQLKYIDLLETMDTASLEYSSYCFLHARACGLYKTKNPAPRSKTINDSLKKCPWAAYLSNMTNAPVSGLYKNEHYTTLNLSASLAALKGKVKVFGIYGQDDGLFDAAEIAQLQSAIGAENFTFVPDASHTVFVDRPDVFIALIKKYMH